MTTEHPLRKWQEAIWLLAALLTPLFVNLWVEQQFEASKVWLLRTLIWGLAALTAVGWLTGFRQRSLSAPIGSLVVFLLLVLGLSTFYSSDHFMAIFGSLERANGVVTQGCYLLFFWCTATQIDRQQSRQLVYVVIWTAVPIGLLALAQASGWQPIPVLTDARSPLTTTLGRANFTGAYLALLLPLTLTAAQQARSKRGRAGFGALALLEVGVIALTQARAAWLAAVVGAGVLMWLRNAPGWSRRLRALGAAGGLGVFAVALLLILQRGIANAGSIAARWTIWQASLRLLWPKLWLGYGADTLELHFPSVYPPQLVYYQGRGVVVDRAHNWLLDWSLNYGIVATVLFGALVMIVMRQGWKRLVIGQAGDDSAAVGQLAARPWLAAFMAGVCAHLVGNLFLFDVAATAIVFWILLALICAESSRGEMELVPLRLPLWLRSGAIAAVVLILGWAVWQSSVRPLLADLHGWRGTRAVASGELLTALAEYETAVSYQPRRAAYHVAAALSAAQLGRFDEAEAAMRAAISLRPSDPVLYAQLAAVYGHQGIEMNAAEKIELAYDGYEQAIAAAPTTAQSYQQYADLALRSGDISMAIAQAQQAIDLDATDGISFGIMGWAQLQSGELTAALYAFEQAVKWQPDTADFHLGLATVYYQQGSLAAAQQAASRSLHLDPGYAPALTLLSRLDEN